MIKYNPLIKRVIFACTLFAYTPLPSLASQLEEVIVSGTRLPASATSLAGSWSLVKEDELELVRAGHIQELLERLPGVNLHRNNGQEYLPSIRSPVLSGPGACGSFVMAEDGIPLRPAGFCNVNELFEAHSEQASRIEVARGPGITLYGSNAMHGVINIISPATIGGDNRAGVDISSLDSQQLRLHAAEGSAAAAVTLTHDEGFRDDYGVDQQKISLKYGYKGEGFTATTGFTGINLNQETAGYIEGTDSFKVTSIAESNPNPEAYRDAWATRLWTRIEDEGEQPDWVITPYARKSQMTFLQHFLPGQPIEENGQQSVGIQSSYYFRSENTTVITGLDVEWVDGWLEQYQTGPTQGSAFLTATIPQGHHYDYDIEGVQAAPFIQWQWQLDALTLNAGLRYEYLTYDYDNNMLTGRTRDDGTDCNFGGCRYRRPADSKDTFTNLSPSLGLSYDLNETNRVTLQLARGFRAPQAVELYRLQREQSIADLESEELDSIELGFRGDTGDLAYDIAFYAMKKDNVIYRDSDFYTISDGETEHLGMEVSLRYQVSDSLALLVSGTEARHEYKNNPLLASVDVDGNDVDSAPHRFGSVQLQWQPTDTLFTELSWQHMGAYYTDPENLHSYGGHDLLNLRASWQATQNASISARLTNVTDRKYAKRADYSSFGGDRYFPGQPRALSVSLDYLW